MKVSVIIPAYNCEKTIREAIESALAQTVQPYEVLVMNDGSTDGTAAILEMYQGQVIVRSQPNAGVGRSRDALCSLVTGDVVAPLDSDDIWHPRYLEGQLDSMRRHPDAVAYFADHLNFLDGTEVQWPENALDLESAISVLASPEFLRKYNEAPGRFACVSYCCIPVRVLRMLGEAPFKLRVSEDLYFCNRLAALGSVVCRPDPLVAYRIRGGSLSSDLLTVTTAEVTAFEMLKPYFEQLGDATLSRLFRLAIAGKKRRYARSLMGARKVVEARRQLKDAVSRWAGFESAAKSMMLLLTTYLPAGIQPKWPVSGYDPRVECAR